MVEATDWFMPFKDGDEIAFRRIFDKYYRPVSYFATKILDDDVIAKDVVSESFRKAWDGRKKFATPRHLENFLYLVTRNACIDQIRTKKLADDTKEELEYLAVDDYQTDSPQDLEKIQARLIQCLYEKMSVLPEGDVLRMSFVENKSTAEIAAALKITENNVYILKSRGLKKLRAMLSRSEWLLFLYMFIR